MKDAHQNKQAEEVARAVEATSYQYNVLPPWHGNVASVLRQPRTVYRIHKGRLVKEVK